MSDLKFPFKFKCRNYEAPVYTANLNTRSGRVEFLWEYEDGSYGHTSFPLDDTKAYVSEGFWIIQQEGKSVDSDPNVTIKQSELDALIDEINMLRECVADMNKLLEEKLVEEEVAPTFKPISEMTMEDWKQAKEEGWVFETRDGGNICVAGFSNMSSTYPVVGDNDLNYTIGGKFYYHEQHRLDIVKRIQ